MSFAPPPFDAFTNRYATSNPLSTASKKSADRFFTSCTGFVTELLAHMESGYDAVRYDAINAAIVGAQRMTEIELGRRALFPLRNHILPYRTCYIDDCENYLASSRIDASERMTYLEYLLAHCARNFQAQWPSIEDRLNNFLKTSEIPLIYHGMNFVPVDDERIMDEVAIPFWSLVEDPVWSNVRSDMEEAFRQRDTGQPNAALHAARALESTVKIISDERKWTRGNERGAHAYIDNLASGDRYISQWESAIIKPFFTHVRNPHAHGAGSNPQPTLSAIQTAWTLEFCMVCIKSLVRRF
jgi:hypothetical protein